VCFLNPGNSNHWITLRLEGVVSNRSAIGARLRLRLETPDGERDVYATVSTGGSFGSSSLQQEIGLGNASAIRSLEITWPSGARQSFANIGMDRILRVRETEAKPISVEAKPVNLQRAVGKASHHHHPGPDEPKQ
jgi:hypothetical protein